MLTNSDGDGIDSLDGEDDRPFQSFASQMQNFGKKSKATHSNYTKLDDKAAGSSTDAHRQLEEI